MSLNTTYPVYNVPDLSVGSYLIIIIIISEKQNIKNLKTFAEERKNEQNTKKPWNEIYITKEKVKIVPLGLRRSACKANLQKRELGRTFPSCLKREGRVLTILIELCVCLHDIADKYMNYSRPFVTEMARMAGVKVERKKLLAFLTAKEMTMAAKRPRLHNYHTLWHWVTDICVLPRKVRNKPFLNGSNPLTRYLLGGSENKNDFQSKLAKKNCVIFTFQSRSLFFSQEWFSK